MQGSYSVPYLFYIHCEAGTDRTGEISGAYYIQARPAHTDSQIDAYALTEVANNSIYTLFCSQRG